MFKEIFRHIHPLKLAAWAVLFFAASVFAEVDHSPSAVNAAYVQTGAEESDSSLLSALTYFW